MSIESQKSITNAVNLNNSIKKNIFLITLGCSKNLVDSETVTAYLTDENFTFIQRPEEAEIIIINTCGFLDAAREENIEIILHAAEMKKTGNCEQLIVAGCMSERFADEMRDALPEVDRFFGVSDYQNILRYLTGDSHKRIDPNFHRILLTPKHYAYLKISEGCDADCSFCSIPLIRGEQKSRTIEDIVLEAKMLSQQGVQELLIISQDTSAYGRDLNGVRLRDLLSEIVKIDDIQWIRLHYFHPNHFDRKLISIIANNPKIVPYIDIPLQHINDRILRSMKRGRDSIAIRGLLDDLRNGIPKLALRTTFIVGYPGETNAEFSELADFVSEQKFHRLGSFTYSEEIGTAAAKLKDTVSQELKIERQQILMSIQQDIALKYNENLIGKTLDVMIDEVLDTTIVGRTIWDSPEVDNLVTIDNELSSMNNIRPGQVVKTKIVDATEYDLFGKIENL